MSEDEPSEGAPPVHDLEGRHAAAIVVVAGAGGEGKEVLAHVQNYQNVGLNFLGGGEFLKGTYSSCAHTTHSRNISFIKIHQHSSTPVTYISKHVLFSHGNLLQVHVGGAVLKGEPAPGALALELLLGPPSVADD